MSRNLTTEEVWDKIKGIDNLPTLPTIASEVVAAAQDPDSSVDQIGKVIEKDPPLTAKVLKVANSPMYGLRKEITSIRHALVIMGLKEVENLVLSVSVFNTFPEEPGKASFDREAFWEHSMACSDIAKILAAKLGLRFDGKEFVAGLVHDIGKILFDEYFHEEFSSVLERTTKEDIPMIEAERAVLGVTHCEVGAFLANRWNIPPPIEEAIRFHHAIEEASIEPVLTAIIHLANVMAKVKGIGFCHGSMVFSLEDDPAWSILTEIKPELAELDIERFTFELDDEVEKVKELVRSVRT